MKTNGFCPIPMPRVALLGGLFSLSLGILACGSPPEPIGASEQPISADSDAPEEGADPACADGIAPADAVATECQVTARGLCFASAEEACACAGCGSDECALAESFPVQAVCPTAGDGSDPDGSDSDGPDPNAPVSSTPSGAGPTGNGGGAEPGPPGCGATAPTDPSEPSHSACAAGVERDGEGQCHFVAGGSCFADSDSACACAGCAPAECLILESYPVQVTCAR